MAPPQTTKQRNSSIELYRIIATFAVLIVHFNGWFVGGMPEKLDLANPSAFRIGQAIIGSATCICVNMFLIISGYFGIRFKLSSIIKISLLLLFIFVPFYLVGAIIQHSFSIKELISRFFVITRSGYFVQCYLMLMFISPLLNAFIERMGKKILAWVIIFMLIEFWFDNIREVKCLGFGGGYSVMHFVLIYMIARCLFLYRNKLIYIHRCFWVIGYFVCTIVILGQYIMGMKWTFAYSNPIVIVSTICTFVPFVSGTFHSNIINWFASSTFAVYIIQVTNPVYSSLVQIDSFLLESNPYGIYLMLILCVICAFFVLCVFYDKLCGIFINPITSKLKNRYDERFDLGE